MKRKLWVAAVGASLVALGSAVMVKRLRAGSVPASVSAPLVESGERTAIPLDVAETAYDSKLGKGWEGWGWGWGADSSSSVAGPARVMFANFAGIQLRHATLRERYGGLAFRYKAPPGWPEFLTVSVAQSEHGPAPAPHVTVELRHVAKLADGWREVVIPWSELDPSNLPIDGLSIAARRLVANDLVLIEKVVLLKAGSEPLIASGPTREVVVSARCGGATHPISPLIYGASGGDWAAGVSAVRVGGNAMTRLNWDLGDTWNTGNDWFFENVKGDKGSLWNWLDTNMSHSVQTAVTVPMIGWVAKDATSYGFPVSKFGAQRKTDAQYRPDAGDGFRSDGKPIAPGSPTQTSIPAPPELISRWITQLRERDRTRGRHSVVMYMLDNEPSLWNVTHRDIHPDPLTYDELMDRTVRYASAIRDADPDALIAGPTEWGWTGYFFSAKDRESSTLLRLDRRAHGDTPLIPWYLQQLATYQKDHGKRLLDVLDVHFYPAADNIYGSNGRTDEEGSALRLRSTRALWDPTYRDESWINDRISLIPRLKDWVEQYYPGLKISIGEWSFGADNHISGALATVEALGRFGQQGLYSAFYWGGPAAGSKTLIGFRAFRNFDGKGGHFENVSLPTVENDRVSLFASSSDSGDHIVAILVNKDPAYGVDAHVKLTTCGSRVSQRAWSYDLNSADLHETPIKSSDDQSITVSMTPFSFVVLDIDLKAGSHTL